MKKKLLSLLVAATMIGSMAGTTTVFAGEELEDVSEPVTLSLMVTTRPSSDKRIFTWIFFQSWFMRNFQILPLK